MQWLRSSRFYTATAAAAVWIVMLGSFSASRLSLFLQASGEACCGMQVCCCAASGAEVCACSPDDGTHSDMVLLCGVPDDASSVPSHAVPVLEMAFKAILNERFLLPKPAYSLFDRDTMVRECDGFPQSVQAPPRAFSIVC
jgi:hypothetical protein